MELVVRSSMPVVRLYEIGVLLLWPVCILALRVHAVFYREDNGLPGATYLTTITIANTGAFRWRRNGGGNI